MIKNYSSIHHWLYKYYGKANHCDNPNCKHICNKFEWAVIHEKDYDYNIENFKQLCTSCHQKYDNQFDKWKKEFGIEIAIKMHKESNIKRSLALTNISKSSEWNDKNRLGRLGSKLINGHFVHN